MKEKHNILNQNWEAFNPIHVTSISPGDEFIRVKRKCREKHVVLISSTVVDLLLIFVRDSSDQYFSFIKLVC